MLHSTRKFIAVIMLLWLPVFTGSALAASVSMQLPQGGCNEKHMSQAMPDGNMDMSMDMGEHMMHHDAAPTADAAQSSCGVCHLACTAYLAVPGTAVPAVRAAARENTPYLVAFDSVSSTPLLPPPLVRA
jgi:hypothetical protein